MEIATKNDIETLGTKIDTLGTTLSAKIDTLGTTLSAKIDTLGTTLGAKIDTLGKNLIIAFKENSERTGRTKETTEDARSASTIEWTTEDKAFINNPVDSVKGHPDTRRYLVDIKNGIWRRLFAAILLVLTTVMFT